MRWQKLGLVYCPSGNQEWASTHALLPTARIIDDRLIEVYYASLDNLMMGRIGLLYLDAFDPKKIVKIVERPVLDVGAEGCFDDCGVNPSCLIDTPSGLLLYYIGWQRTKRVPYALFAGAARVESDGTLKRISNAPLLDRTNLEPILRSATTIVRHGDEYFCYYVSAHRWIEVRGKSYPEYTISMARSWNAQEWKHCLNRVIDFESPQEFGFGRPWVLKENGTFKMFYSIRSKIEPYRLGYSESPDGITWKRYDKKLEIKRSADGWDSEMICYPCVLDARGSRYLFYNGNGHGTTGFGVAILEDD